MSAAYVHIAYIYPYPPPSLYHIIPHFGPKDSFCSYWSTHWVPILLAFCCGHPVDVYPQASSHWEGLWQSPTSSHPAGGSDAGCQTARCARCLDSLAMTLMVPSGDRKIPTDELLVIWNRRPDDIPWLSEMQLWILLMVFCTWAYLSEGTKNGSSAFNVCWDLELVGAGRAIAAMGSWDHHYSSR